MVNTGKLQLELDEAGISTSGCNIRGVVWDKDNNEIQTRKDVAEIIAKHDPTPLPNETSLETRIADLEKKQIILIKAVDEEKLSIDEITDLSKEVNSG